MDSTDPDIFFDSDGICNHCHEYERKAATAPFMSPGNRQEKLEELVEIIRQKGRNSPYDCVIGVSGGVDSSFLAYKVKELGLRPLAVHLDNGWNSELAVSNIHNLVTKLKIDLFTHVIDWEEFRDLQISFLRASTPDGEIPTDHAIGAIIYQMAIKHNVPYVIFGHNLATEATLPVSWAQGHGDFRYISAVHSRFGKVPLRTFPFYRYFGIPYRLFRRFETAYLLNYCDFNKKDATSLLETKIGWRPYEGKHYESIYTRFFQGYVLPTKFGIDKRRAHLSNLVTSKQISRVEALAEIARPAYPSKQLLDADLEFVPKKLGLSQSEFAEIMALPIKSYWDYPNYFKGLDFRLARAIYQPVKKLKLGFS